MIRRTALLAAISLALWQPQAVVAAPAAAAAVDELRDTAVQAYPLPSGKPASIVILAPEAAMSELQPDGAVKPNATWSSNARREIAAALRAELRTRHAQMTVMDEQIADYRARAQAQPRQAACQAEGAGANVGPPPVPALPTCSPGTATGPQSIDAEARVADYAALYREVVDAILAYRDDKGGDDLPAKHGAFAFTLGPGTQELGEVSGANYGLFVLTDDAFASDSSEGSGRGRMGCILGLCAAAHGHHAAYASLVELETGNVVWFNVERGSKADVREEAGARQLIRALLARMPTRPGEVMAPPPVKRRSLL